MKHLKLFIASLFLMLGMAVHAQQVEITKTDGTVDVFKPNEVDSVVYKPAPKYYYYAGWACPKTEEDLAKFAKAPNGGQLTSLTGLDTNKDYFPETVTGPYDYWYFVIPTDLNVYDYVSGSIMTNNVMFIKEKNQPIPNHTIWKSSDDNKTDEFAGLKIY